MGVEPKIWENPQIIPFVHRVFHEINTIHFGVPLFLETSICLLHVFQGEFSKGAFRLDEGHVAEPAFVTKVHRPRRTSRTFTASWKTRGGGLF